MDKEYSPHSSLLPPPVLSSSWGNSLKPCKTRDLQEILRWILIIHPRGKTQTWASTNLVATSLPRIKHRTQGNLNPNHLSPSIQIKSANLKDHKNHRQGRTITPILKYQVYPQVSTPLQKIKDRFKETLHPSLLIIMDRRLILTCKTFKSIILRQLTLTITAWINMHLATTCSILLWAQTCFLRETFSQRVKRKTSKV